jgi:hypothetical protein
MMQYLPTCIGYELIEDLSIDGKRISNWILKKCFEKLGGGGDGMW